MARIYGIKKRMAGYGFDEKRIKEIIGNGDLVDVIARMETLLEPGMMHEILDSCACLGGQKYLDQCKKTGKELAGKSLEEKIDHLNSHVFFSERIALNGNNLLTGAFSFPDNEGYRCVCSAAVKKGATVADLTGDAEGRDMPLAYCICCAGSFRRHLQLQLGVELRTKEIISSPINSRGEKPCEFVLEIVNA